METKAQVYYSFKMPISDRVHGVFIRYVLAMDSILGSPVQRWVLSGVLDRLGSDGRVASLRKMSVEDLNSSITEHVRWLEQRAVEELEVRIKRLLDTKLM